ncbi:DeoR family transcriptional regulator [Testudinibacter sp. P80/BLE/0925]|uniref:DeoR family transcriptional regulator n=1 Tax=Testudinibacter sp. TW-1 TaxID=3417757 RepID=UPI003D35BF53
MIPAERQKRILTLLTEHDLISIAELVEIMQVSHMTVRRDIQKLEEQGKVVSVSGGVQLLQRLFIEPTHDDKSLLFQAQKQAIGTQALQFLGGSKTIYLDAGTTTLEIAYQLAQREDLLVITNDFVIAHFLIKEGKCDLIHTGGYVCKENYSSVGELSAQFLRNISIDVAFISTSSWNLKGLTTPDEKKLAVKRAIVESSKKNILVTDASKYGKVATFWIYGLDVFDTIITDRTLLESVQKNIQNLNIELVLA